MPSASMPPPAPVEPVGVAPRRRPSRRRQSHHSQAATSITSHVAGAFAATARRPPAHHPSSSRTAPSPRPSASQRRPAHQQTHTASPAARRFRSVEYCRTSSACTTSSSPSSSSSVTERRDFHVARPAAWARRTARAPARSRRRARATVRRSGPYRPSHSPGVDVVPVLAGGARHQRPVRPSGHLEGARSASQLPWVCSSSRFRRASSDARPRCRLMQTIPRVLVGPVPSVLPDLVGPAHLLSGSDGTSRCLTPQGVARDSPACGVVRICLI